MIDINSSPTRWKQFPLPPRCYEFWEDFDDELALTSNEPVAASSGWIGTALSSGTTAFSTDAENGVVVLSGAATTDNTGSQLQRDMEFAALLTGKTTRVMIRAKLSDFTNSHAFAGLSITDTTVLDGADAIAGLTPTDCIGFFKPDDAATIYMVAKRDSVAVANTAVASLSDDTYYWFVFEVQMDASTAGKGTIQAWVFNSLTLLMLGQTGPVNAVNLPYSGEEILTPTLALVSGNATGTKTMTVDSFGLLQER